MKVLIIDDNNYKITEAKYILNTNGLTKFDIAGSVHEARIKERNNSYDLIIADLGLPMHDSELDIDPLMGLLMVRLFKKDTPVIFFSETIIPEDDLLDIMEDYPVIAQAHTMFELDEIIKEWLAKSIKRCRENNKDT